MWWIVKAIAGIFGAAQAILDALRQEAAKERQEWERDYKKREAEIKRTQEEVDSALSKVDRWWGKPSVDQLRMLHRTSAELADHTYKNLQGARKTLDAMGKAIVDAAQRRGEFEKQKAQAATKDRERLEKEIRSLHKLRDEILIPDKDRIMSERDQLLARVQMLNKQTAQLRDQIKSMK